MKSFQWHNFILAYGLTLFVCLLGNNSVHAQDSKVFKKLGDQYYQAEKYRDALDAYQKFQEFETGDRDVIQRMGICYYFINNIPQSKRYLTNILDGKTTPSPEVYFFLARAYHAEHEFEQAIQFYKSFLRNVSIDNVNRPMVKDAIRRCSNGMRMEESNVIVENMGEKVNSIGDDFRPVLSPNFSDRLYFSSSREGTLGGLRDREGREDDFMGKYSSDMFSTSIQNGEWSITEPMRYLLNSPKHDVIMDFSEDGKRLYYFQGHSLYSGDILVDTFKARIEERSLFSTEFQGPARAWEGDIDVSFFNDTTLLFASRRPGGFGGLDLYISVYRNNIWSYPRNLGPTINSAYDERSPFLAADGRTLYFSSNNAAISMGGLDIFKTAYNDQRETWSIPENLQIPINSSGDDSYFSLSKDGTKGYFSSSRKSGMGMRDLYVSYFRGVMEEQTQASNPASFYDVPEYNRLVAQGKIGGEEKIADANKFNGIKVKNYYFEDLSYGPKGDVLTIDNKRQLNAYAELLREHPTAGVLLTCHSDGNDPVEFDLFFSIKRAEEAAKYLVEQGIKAEQITVRGVGSAYPRAMTVVNGNENPLGFKLNRRIEVSFHNTYDLPIKVEIRKPEINEMMRSASGLIFNRINEGLTYKVQIATIKQMYKGNLIQEYPHAAVERIMNSDVYYYTLGSVAYFNSADQLRQDLVTKGIKEALVVPYLRGVRSEQDFSEEELASYPDLSNYLRSQ